VASVSCGWLMKCVERGELRRILIVGSGAMLSATSCQQGQTIPGIAYAICIEGGQP
jgi:stage V sporulation protein AD